MSDKQIYDDKHNQPQHYEIRIKGHLDDRWAGWFEGLSITLEEDGDTILSGSVVDQAALHGLLKQVRDLGLPLVSVSPVESGQAGTGEIDSSNLIQEIHPYRLKKEKK